MQIMRNGAGELGIVRQLKTIHVCGQDVDLAYDAVNVPTPLDSDLSRFMDVRKLRSGQRETRRSLAGLIQIVPGETGLPWDSVGGEIFTRHVWPREHVREGQRTQAVVFGRGGSLILLGRHKLAQRPSIIVFRGAMALRRPE